MPPPTRSWPTSRRGSTSRRARGCGPRARSTPRASGGLTRAPPDTERRHLGVKIVELAPPYCGGPNPVTSGKCDNNEPPTAYAYRNEPGAVWNKGELQIGRASCRERG